MTPQLAIQSHLESNGVEQASVIGSLYQGEKEITTSRGERVLVELKVGDELWEAWRHEKSDLKKSGVSVSKFQGRWNAGLWMEPSKWSSLINGSSAETPAERPPVTPDTEFGGVTTHPDSIASRVYGVAVIETAYGLTANPAQIQGVKAAVGCCVGGGRGFLIADQMGSGKTLQSILTAKTLMDENIIDKVLVLTKASLCSMWNTVLRKDGQKTYWIKKSKDVDIERGNEDWVVCNYSLAIRGETKDALQKFVNDRVMIIMDESHAVKSTGFTPSKISQLVWGFGKGKWVPPVTTGNKSIVKPGYYNKDGGLAEVAKFVLCLTGTPTPNGKASELHGFLSTATNEIDKDYHRYGTHYCGLEKIHIGGGRTVWSETQNTNTKQWRALVDGVRIQRPVSAFADLPPITFTDHTVEPTKEVVRMERGIEEIMQDVMDAVDRGSEPHFTKFAEVMRCIGLAKTAVAADLIETIIEDNGPVVVFVRHNDALDNLHHLLNREKKIRDIVRMDASMSGVKRGKQVDEFQNGNGKVFLTTIGVAAEGLTLTRANQAILVELDYTPGRINQAIARIHRIGQNEHCTVHRITMEKTIDETLWDIINRKEENIKRQEG